MGYVKRTCAYCGNEYMGSPNGKFCSRNCRSQAHVRKLAAERGEQTCPVCGTPFMPITMKQRFCSKSCETKWSHENKWSEKARTCVTCGNPFMSQRKDMKECPECRKERVKKCYVLSQYGRDRAQLLESTGKLPGNWSEIRKLVLERDKDTCQICGAAVHLRMSVHHKDMNRSNSNLDNLVTLCPSCHAFMHGVIDRFSVACGPENVKPSELFDLLFTEVKRRKKSGTPCEGQSDLKAIGDNSQGQRLPVGEDLSSTDTRPTHSLE